MAPSSAWRRSRRSISGTCIRGTCKRRDVKIIFCELAFSLWSVNNSRNSLHRKNECRGKLRSLRFHASMKAAYRFVAVPLSAKSGFAEKKKTAGAQYAPLQQGKMRPFPTDMRNAAAAEDIVFRVPSAFGNRPRIVFCERQKHRISVPSVPGNSPAKIPLKNS